VKKKTLGFGNSVFLLGGMSKGQSGRFCNPTFHRKDRESSIKKLALPLKREHEEMGRWGDAEKDK